MFRLVFIVASVLLLAENARSTSENCRALLREVEQVFAVVGEVMPNEQQAAIGQMGAMGLDIGNNEQVAALVCGIADATSQRELAAALQVPLGVFKQYYSQAQFYFQMLGGIEGLENMVIADTTILRALAEAGFPDWPMTKSYEEWLSLVNGLIDEVGDNFLEYLVVPQLSGISVPRVTDPEFFARQLAEATSTEDWARRNYMEPQIVSMVLDGELASMIRQGKIDGALALASGVYDLIELIDSFGLLDLPNQK